MNSGDEEELGDDMGQLYTFSRLWRSGFLNRLRISIAKWRTRTGKDGYATDRDLHGTKPHLSMFPKLGGG